MFIGHVVVVSAVSAIEFLQLMGPCDRPNESEMLIKRNSFHSRRSVYFNPNKLVVPLDGTATKKAIHRHNNKPQ